MTTAGGASSDRPDSGGGGGGGGGDHKIKPVGGGQRQTDPSWSVTPANYIINNQPRINATSICHTSDREELSHHQNYSETKIMKHNEAASHQEQVEDNDEFDDNNYEDHDDEEELSEALLAVASAEEYAAKIIKLQQACLTPLKEDLADWLNKILNTSNITTENFMDKLDNGVIICRLAKIISVWCEQQLTNEQSNNVHSTTTTTTTTNTYNDKTITEEENYFELPPTARPRLAAFTTNPNGPLRSTSSQSTNCIASAASTNSLNHQSNWAGSYHPYHSNQFLNNLISMNQTKIWEEARGRTFYARDNVCNFIKWSKEFGVNQSVLFESDDLVLHANPRQVVLCLLDVARIAYVKYGFTEAPGLVKFEQEIDRELAAEQQQQQQLQATTTTTTTTGTFDQVDSSSDARLSRHRSSDNKPNNDSDGILTADSRQASSRARSSRGLSIGDATDELIMRYCKHKEEEALRKKKQQEEQAEQEELDRLAGLRLAGQSDDAMLASSLGSPEATERHPRDLIDGDSSPAANGPGRDLAADSLEPSSTVGRQSADTPTGDMTTHTANAKAGPIHETGRVDSLDSGEGPTESASTGRSSRANNGTATDGHHEVDEQPDSSSSSVVAVAAAAIADKTTSPSVTSQDQTNESSMTNDSEVSSSRSSLLSNQESSGNNNSNNHSSSYGRHITSDLDGKVMRIAKSYYGKGATKDVTRLSEGKYKIADRIVFVRLLKGHRVMVRIGGGWDTLENFLFRHKSDPSQVIDVDNLLPIETKMSFEKSGPPQMLMSSSSSSNSTSNTPTHHHHHHHHHHHNNSGSSVASGHKSTMSTSTSASSSSRLPYYRRSNSASSTNLSMSNLSASNHSITSTSSPLANNHHHHYSGRPAVSTQQLNTNHNSSSVESSPINNGRTGRQQQQQIPYLLIHKMGQAHNISNMKLPNNAFYRNNNNINNKSHQKQSQEDNSKQPQLPQTNGPSPGATSLLRRPLYYQQQLHQLNHNNSNNNNNTQTTTPNHSHHHPNYTNKFNYLQQQQLQLQRPLASSRAPTSSATNLYPATLTTRLMPNSIKSMASARLSLNSANNLHNMTTTTTTTKAGLRQQPANSLNKQQYGRSDESLQATTAGAASYKSSPQHFRHHHNSNSNYNGNSSNKLNGSHQQINNGNNANAKQQQTKIAAPATAATTTTTRIVSNKRQNLKLNDTNDNGLVEEKKSESNIDIILL